MKTDYVNEEGKKVIPIRIREARIARGYSLSELAEKLNVSKQSISKYELGAMNIPSDNLFKLSSELNFPISFFLKPKESVSVQGSQSITYFRSLKATSKKERASLEQKVDFVNEIVIYLGDYIEFPELDIPADLMNGPKGSLEVCNIDNIAKKLREYWGIGSGPIKNLANLLLKKGFIISRVDLDSQRVDAFSRWINGKPFIILGADKNSAVRSRFDLAHELGHIILHSHLDDEEFKVNIDKIENEANKFASSFLLPEEEFVKDIYNISLSSFVYLKEKWKVSIGAMIYRCYDLGILNDNQYTSLQKQISFKKWRKVEPLDDVISFEEPTLLSEAIKLLIDNDIISAEQLIDDLCFNEEEIECLCFLEKEYLNSKKSLTFKPKLKVIK